MLLSGICQKFAQEKLKYSNMLKIITVETYKSFEGKSLHFAIFGKFSKIVN